MLDVLPSNDFQISIILFNADKDLLLWPHYMNTSDYIQCVGRGPITGLALFESMEAKATFYIEQN